MVLDIFGKQCNASIYLMLLTYPDWPVKVLLAQTGLVKLVDVGDPLEAVAGDEHRHDDEADL